MLGAKGPDGVPGSLVISLCFNNHLLFIKGHFLLLLIVFKGPVGIAGPIGPLGLTGGQGLPGSPGPKGEEGASGAKVYSSISL